MTQKYAFEEYNAELMSKACGLSLGFSTKQGVEICNAIRKKPLPRAKKILEEAMEGKKAIPFRRFNSDVGHKTKIGPGRYAIKASTEILSIIKSAESNAQIKGLNTSNMVIRHICCHKASTPWHFGRQRGVKMKRTHVEVVLEEVKTLDKETKSEKRQPKKKEVSNETKSESIKKPEPTKEVKPEVVKEVKPEKVEKVIGEKKEEKEKKEEQVPQEKVVQQPESQSQPKLEVKKSESQELKKEDEKVEK